MLNTFVANTFLHKTNIKGSIGLKCLEMSELCQCAGHQAAQFHKPMYPICIVDLQGTFHLKRTNGVKYNLKSCFYLQKIKMRYVRSTFVFVEFDEFKVCLLIHGEILYEIVCLRVPRLTKKHVFENVCYCSNLYTIYFPK